MLDNSKLDEWLDKYEQDFGKRHDAIQHKVDAIACFDENWQPSASNFAAMLKRSLSGAEKIADSLLTAKNSDAFGKIVSLAKDSPDDVREMFRVLYDESGDTEENRVRRFRERTSELLKCAADEHQQDRNAVSVYLWLQAPRRYYVCNTDELHTASVILTDDAKYQGYDLYGAIDRAVQQREGLVNKFKKDFCSDRAIVHNTSKIFQNPDRIFSMIDHRLLTADVVTYVVENCSASVADASAAQHGYWLLCSARKGEVRFGHMAVGEKQAFGPRLKSGEKRRTWKCLLEARAGDLLICYDTGPVCAITALGVIAHNEPGVRLIVRKTKSLAQPIGYNSLIRCPELRHTKGISGPNGTLFRLTPTEYEFIMGLIRKANPAPTSTIEQAASQESVAVVDSYTRANFLAEVYMDESQYKDLETLLKLKRNIILQGPPGVGKTFAAKRLAYAFMGERDDKRLRVVQFHQSYAYEDFVMGYKPTETGFELRYGVFYDFCKQIEQDNKAHKDKPRPHFLIIDEINRGNLSKIFGELLMLIERDHRGEEVTLAYKPDVKFSVPDNLYIIGTMNKTDRSLAMMDYALRRRFGFVDIEAEFDSDGFKEARKKVDSPKLDALVNVVKELNKAIAADPALGKDFCIGHSYFCKADEIDGEHVEKWLRMVVEHDLIPTLEEYWFDNKGKCKEWQGKLSEALK